MAQADNSLNFSPTHIIGWKSKNKFRIQVRILGPVFPLHALRGGFTDHAVRTKHTGELVKSFVVGRDHAAFNRAHVMPVIKRKVGGQAEGTHAPSPEKRSVRFTGVFNEGDFLLLKYPEHAVRQSVVAEDMRQKNGLRRG